jgi:hypothetical protein
VFGDRWSLLVLRDIAFGDRRSSRQLQAAHPLATLEHTF